MQARSCRDIASQAQEHDKLVGQAETLQENVASSQDRLQQFKEVMNWNEEELQRWAAVAVEKEEDRLALAQYQRQDESKVKDLNSRLDRQGRPID